MVLRYTIDLIGDPENNPTFEEQITKMNSCLVMFFMQLYCKIKRHFAYAPTHFQLPLGLILIFLIDFY